MKDDFFTDLESELTSKDTDIDDMSGVSEEDLSVPQLQKDFKKPVNIPKSDNIDEDDEDDDDSSSF